jgi:hypothetical protein
MHALIPEALVTDGKLNAKSRSEESHWQGSLVKQKRAMGKQVKDFELSMKDKITRYLL